MSTASSRAFRRQRTTCAKSSTCLWRNCISLPSVWAHGPRMDRFVFRWSWYDRVCSRATSHSGSCRWSFHLRDGGFRSRTRCKLSLTCLRQQLGGASRERPVLFWHHVSSTWCMHFLALRRVPSGPERGVPDPTDSGIPPQSFSSFAVPVCPGGCREEGQSGARDPR